jgi:TRAP-type C4-dicarboxylate transport system substrate-binding protein
MKCRHSNVRSSVRSSFAPPRARFGVLASTAWLLICALLMVPAATRVAATETKVVRLATLAPQGSSWDRVFKAWNNSLSEKTGGSLKFQFFNGGVAGDERDVIRKMKLGQLDAGSLTAIGLGQIARSISLLQMPGVVDSYAQLNQLRSEMSSDFEGLFEKDGYRLLGWGDAGFGRILSKKPILMPSDYKTVRPWVPRDDSSLPEFMKLIGANGVPLSIPEVFPALQTGMVDTVLCSAIAAVALQWFRHVDYVSKEAAIPIVGATLLREEFFKSLTPEQQQALLETGKTAHEVLVRQIQTEDQKAFTTLTGKLGLKEFSTQGTPEQVKAWNEVNAKLKHNLTGKLWSKEFYSKVTDASARAKAKVAK